MSSFVVSSATAYAVASAIKKEVAPSENIHKLAQDVLNLNIIATAARYEEEPKPIRVDSNQLRDFTDAEMIGCSKCWMYQVAVDEVFCNTALYYLVKVSSEMMLNRKLETKEWYSYKQVGSVYYYFSDTNDEVDIPWGIYDVSKDETSSSKRMNHRTRVMGKRCKR